MYKVLIVDDSKTFHTYLKDLIGSFFELHHLLDPRDCLHCLENKHVDIILLDLEMPHIDGFSLSQLIHENEKLSTIPILILTGSYSEKLIMGAIDSFAMDILPKDSKKEFLIQKINGVVRQKRLIEDATRKKQIMAINAMLATTNHELNNALQILSSTLNKYIKKPEERNDSALLKIKDCGDKINETIKKLNNIDSIELEDYTSKVPMLKI